jgi:saccharopine dehydrogenase-like NADP-dependent oxidoreductase
MKFVVLGGAGDMGGEVVADLAQFSPESQVVMVDLRRDVAEKKAKSIGLPNVMVEQCDVNRRDDVLGVLKDAKIVVNCVGPFYKYEKVILPLAIESGVGYVDICDDHDATERALSYSDMARSNDVTALIGMGWTPGITNVLARLGAEKLDQAESIHIFWVGSIADSEGLAVTKHVFHVIQGLAPSFENYQWIDVDALSGNEDVEFPDPIGVQNTYYVGHPEPVTIPRYIRGVKNVTLKGTLLPKDINKLGKFLVDTDAVSTEKKLHAVSEFLSGDLVVLSNIFGTKDKPLPVSGLRVDVHGIKAGKPKTFSWGAIDSMGRLTGIPASIGAQMMARGKIKQPGVLPAEACIQPEYFIEELKKRDIEIEEM